MAKKKTNTGKSLGIKDYPGVTFDKETGKWIARKRKGRSTYVATMWSFEAAKKEMKRFERI